MTQPKDRLTRFMDLTLGWLFRGFNAVFTRGANGYSKGVRGVISRKTVMMGIYLVLIGATAFMFKSVPGGFVPPQDKQYLVGFTQLPDGATLDRTEAVVRRIGDMALKIPGCTKHDCLPGPVDRRFHQQLECRCCLRFAEAFRRAQDAGPECRCDRHGSSISKLLGIQESFSAVFPPPPVQGLGSIGGFKLQIEDRNGLGYQALDDATKAFLAKAATAPELTGLFTSYQINVPQLYADVDRAKARQLNVSLPEIFNTLQIYLGSVYVNDFNKFGRTYSVRMQAELNFRAKSEDIGDLKVRSGSGEMIPLSALVNVSSSAGPDRAMRYNGFLAADVNGNAAPGYSSGQARAAVEKIAAETLPARDRLRMDGTDLSGDHCGQLGLSYLPAVDPPGVPRPLGTI